ncbi:MAG TPA: DUF2332 domain-containing protein [Solirubrobacterales bacterium]|nr:DUF2332 domain-containing protein [Solirubrobacterales bacterium]
MTGSAENAIAGQLRWQAEMCGKIGSPLYADLLERAAEDVEAGGPVAEPLRGHEDDPQLSVLGLRLMGAVNRLVMAGREPELADAYAGGDATRAWGALHDAVSRNGAELHKLVELPVQTNEVGRCNALLFGFMAIAAETGMPLRLLEVGASAGLNLRWDRYRYAAGDFSWGPADSPVRLELELEGKPPSFPPTVEIAARHGCDASPIDPTTEEGRLTLLAYIWPDQVERIARMQAALQVALELPVRVDREPAAPWTQRMLSESTPEQATVLYHSIVMQYLSDEERGAFHAKIQAAGERATKEAPLGWLRMEPGGERADVHLTTWPGGATRHIARVGYHGSPVELL